MTAIGASEIGSPSTRNRRRPWSFAQIEFDHIVIVLMLVSDIIMRSRIAAIVPHIVSTVCLAFISAGILYGVMQAILRVDIRSLLVFVAFMTLFVVQLVFFSYSQDRDLNFKALAQMYGPLTVCAFSYFYHTGRFRFITYTILTIAMVYANIYLGLCIANYTGYLPHHGGYDITLYDASRGYRVALAGDLIQFLVLCCIYKALPTNKRRLWLPISIICAVASLSRWFLFSNFIFGVAAKLISLRRLGQISFMMLLCSVAIYVFCILNPPYNPFSVFAGDDSGNARTVSFREVQDIVQRNPIFGVGFPSYDSDLAYAVSDITFSTSDLGVASIWANFGIAGVVMYVISCVFSSFGWLNLPKSEPFRAPYHMLGCLTTVSCCLAPVNWLNPGTIFFGVNLAIAILPRPQASRTVLDGPAAAGGEPRSSAAVAVRRRSLLPR